MTLGPDEQRELTAAVDRMMDVKERRDALDAEYTRLREIVISLSGVGHRTVANTPVTVSLRRTFDPRLAMTRLEPATLALILAPAKVDTKLAKERLTRTQYESCLSDLVTYNVRLG